MKQSKIFILVFILTIILAGPFVIKRGVIDNENKLSASEKIEFIEDLSAENNLEIKDEEIKTEKVVEINKEEIKKEVAVKDYFEDSLFIGDSRTVGLMEYGKIDNATFFANSGMSVYNVQSKSISVPGLGKMKLEELLKTIKFKKIYLMLGINELGYNFSNSVKKYEKLVDYLKENQPEAIIYIEANLHVTKKKSETDKIFNNKNIDLFNNAIKKLDNNKDVFYIDINEKFNDNNGNLDSTLTGDNVHIYGKYYREWAEWLRENTKGGSNDI